MNVPEEKKEEDEKAPPTAPTAPTTQDPDFSLRKTTKRHKFRTLAGTDFWENPTGRWMVHNNAATKETADELQKDGWHWSNNRWIKHPDTSKKKHTDRYSYRRTTFTRGNQSDVWENKHGQWWLAEGATRTLHRSAAYLLDKGYSYVPAPHRRWTQKPLLFETTASHYKHGIPWKASLPGHWKDYGTGKRSWPPDVDPKLTVRRAGVLDPGPHDTRTPIAAVDISRPPDSSLDAAFAAASIMPGASDPRATRRLPDWLLGSPGRVSDTMDLGPADEIPEETGDLGDEKTEEDDPLLEEGELLESEEDWSPSGDDIDFGSDYEDALDDFIGGGSGRARPRPNRPRPAVARPRARTRPIARAPRARARYPTRRVGYRTSVGTSVNRVHGPFRGLLSTMPKLSWQHKGPGHYIAKARQGMTPGIRQHVLKLLSRAKGHIWVNGKRMTVKKSRGHILKLLGARQSVEIKLTNDFPFP